MENNDNDETSSSTMLEAAEKENDSSSLSQQNKKKRTRIDSKGSNHLFREQARHSKIEKDKFQLTAEEIKKVQSKRTPEHYRAILTKLEKNCAWHPSGCCILDKFTNLGKCDYNAVFSKIEECQELSMFNEDNKLLHVRNFKFCFFLNFLF